MAYEHIITSKPEVQRDRYTDALLIQEGACNPTGIAHTFIEHCQRMRDEEGADTNALCSDPALRLMVHQLAFLMNIDRVDVEYPQLVAACRRLQEKDDASQD